MILYRPRKFIKELFYWVVNYFLISKLEHKNPIIIYQMGKVGSSTVKATLKAMNLPFPIFHVHTLNEDHLHHAWKRVRRSINPYAPQHLIVSSLLIKKIQRHKFPCRFVTLSRAPIERAISFVFEDHKKTGTSRIKKLWFLGYGNYERGIS